MTWYGDAHTCSLCERWGGDWFVDHFERFLCMLYWWCFDASSSGQMKISPLIDQVGHYYCSRRQLEIISLQWNYGNMCLKPDLIPQVVHIFSVDLKGQQTGCESRDSAFVQVMIVLVVQQTREATSFRVYFLTTGTHSNPYHHYVNYHKLQLSLSHLWFCGSYFELCHVYAEH